MLGIAPPFRPGWGECWPAEITGLRPAPSARLSERGRPGAWRGRPHGAEAVAQVQRYVTLTEMTYGEIAALTGIGRASICRWTQDGGWVRPPGAPVATDTAGAARGSDRASARLKARTLHRRAQAIAERILDTLERDPGTDPGEIATALAMLQSARLARMPKTRRRPGAPDGPPGSAPAPPRPRGPFPSPHRPEALARQRDALDRAPRRRRTRSTV